MDRVFGQLVRMLGKTEGQAVVNELGVKVPEKFGIRL